MRKRKADEIHMKNDGILYINHNPKKGEFKYFYETRRRGYYEAWVSNDGDSWYAVLTTDGLPDEIMEILRTEEKTCIKNIITKK